MSSKLQNQDEAPELRMHRVSALELDTLATDWQNLAAKAAQPNPFLEPWFLRPSLKQFDPEGTIQLALLRDGRKLLGVMPLERRSHYHDRPIRHLANWQHSNMFCGTPLIAESYERAFWHALLEWAVRHAKNELFLHLRHLPTDGPIFEALVRACKVRGMPLRVVQRQERALLRGGQSAEQHLETALSKKRRKELARKRRRLEESSDFAFTRYRDDTELDQWIDDFLSLEQQSWKGDESSALASDPRTSALFREALRGAAEAGKLDRLAFHTGGKPIAMLVQFLSAPGAFSFKTCFHESLRSLSPGMLLQVENLDLLNRPEIAWCDSCAASDHPMINRIWFDRREIVSVSIPIGSGLRRLAGRALTAIEARRMEARQ